MSLASTRSTSRSLVFSKWNSQSALSSSTLFSQRPAHGRSGGQSRHTSVTARLDLPSSGVIPVHWRSRRVSSLTARMVGELLAPHDRTDVNARGDDDYPRHPEDCDPTSDR